MISEIERAIALEYGWPDYSLPRKDNITLTSDLLNEYVGAYVTASGLQISISRNDDHLYLELQGQSPIPYYSESNTKFYSEAVNAEVTFEANSEGKVAALTIHQGGKKIIADRG